jgi:hypothetical protein
LRPNCASTPTACGVRRASVAPAINVPSTPPPRSSRRIWCATADEGASWLGVSNGAVWL